MLFARCKIFMIRFGRSTLSRRSAGIDMNKFQLVSVIVLTVATVTLVCQQNAENEESTTKADLWSAAAAGDLTEMQRLIEDGDSIDQRNPLTNGTPLLTAVLFGQEEVVKFLLEQGAAVNARDRYGSTPLMTAAFIGNATITKLLLEAGADVTLRNHAMTTASEILDLSWEATQQLANNLFRKDLTESQVFEGRNRIRPMLERAFRDAAAEDIWLAVILGEAELIKKHVENYTDINTLKTDIGIPLLHVAVSSNQLDSVSVLLEAGADVDAIDHLGTPAVLVAALLGYADIAEVLLDAGAATNLKNHDGATLDSMLELDWPTTQFIAQIIQVKIEETAVTKGRAVIREYLDKATVE
ncbi:MAG: ankyrin repeat domain-containing protein [Gammaproteobacteria bacterium]|nr:ankyrin repeat domain-containing protein [Gammaproteobacteria bacterium]MYF52256.1 ankyrin repeat domain-containing protein [Gammaproteobacteria bacterium]MYK42606.1 ankyrin repeat domain-containing protein [Gammaproteobacteria bacterium]